MKSTRGGDHFVAYHSTELMGYELGKGRTAEVRAFFSRKPRTFLEKALGADVWAICGTRDASKRLIYRLVFKYTPSEIRDLDGGFSIRGKDGLTFKPPVVLNELDWFQDLLRAQNKFSFGFSRIHGDHIIAALDSLGRSNSSALSKKAAPAARIPEPDSEPLPVRALSVRQPYAEMIMLGTKKREYRAMSTNIRGRVLIYASRRPGHPDDFKKMKREPGDLPTGVLIGTVEITNSTWGNGEYEWHLKHPRRLADPLEPDRQPQPVWFHPF